MFVAISLIILDLGQILSHVFSENSTDIISFFQFDDY